jgi:hypothetical protein
LLRSYLEKPFTKIGLVGWLKVKALSSNPQYRKKKKKKKTEAIGRRGMSLRGLCRRQLSRAEEAFQGSESSSL